MSLRLDLLLEAINEIDKEDVIEESAKWKEYYDKKYDNSASKIPKATSKEYGKVAASFGGGDNARHLKDGGKAVADDSRKRMEYDREDASHMANFKKADAKESNYTDTSKRFERTVRRMVKSNQVNDKINKRAEQKKAMGESVEDHIAFADTLLELLN